MLYYVLKCLRLGSPTYRARMNTVKALLKLNVRISTMESDLIDAKYAAVVISFLDRRRAKTHASKECISVLVYSLQRIQTLQHLDFICV